MKNIILKLTERLIGKFTGLIRRLKYPVFKESKFIKQLGTKQKAILIVEPNYVHGETIPGYVKYFLDLNYNVDVVLLPYLYEQKSLSIFANDDNVRFFFLRYKNIAKLLGSKKIESYDFVFFNTNMVYAKNISIFSAFKNMCSPKKGFINAEHRCENLNDESFEKASIIALKTFEGTTDARVKMVNPHFFGDIEITPKNNNITRFISIGELKDVRRNKQLLLDTVEKLIDRGVTNFCVSLIHKGEKIQLPAKLKPYFNMLGEVDYPTMYNELEKVDFFLPLLDPENSLHERYLTVGTSGSFQLIYGFCKPCIINKKFAGAHYFDDTNSIIYDTNSEFEYAMLKAIHTTNEKYSSMQSVLKEVAGSIYSQSLGNLKEIINHN